MRTKIVPKYRDYENMHSLRIDNTVDCVFFLNAYYFNYMAQRPGAEVFGDWNVVLEENGEDKRVRESN